MRGRIVRCTHGCYDVQDRDSPGCVYFVTAREVRGEAILTKGQLVEFSVEFDGIRGHYATNVRPVEAA